MHILMTTDTVGGVWTYTRELVSGLARRGHRVTLISFGKIPSQEQAAWMHGLGDLEFRATGFRLEWMQEAERDIEESTAYLENVINEVKPDLLHSNQYAYGVLNTLPCLVVAHSDVVSWWVGVHGEEPPDSTWLRWYREVVSTGLSRAATVVAPSRFMLEAVRRHYLSPTCCDVIYNGRSPSLFNPQEDKDGYILAVGRVWDQAKQVSLLAQREHPLQVWIVGSDEHPDKLLGGHVGNGNNRGLAVRFYGQQSEKSLRVLYARAAAYGATSCYEPFGLAPLEAALSRCAVVANDIPTFQEIWGDSAYYFRRNDADSLAAAIRTLSSNPHLRVEYAERAYLRAKKNFTADQMVDNYERLYRQMSAVQEAAA